MQWLKSVAVATGVGLALLCGREDGAAEPTAKATLKGHRGVVYCVALNPTGKTPSLASGGEDHTIRLWDLEKERELRSFEASDIVFCLAFSPDGSLLASGEGDGTIRLWSMLTFNEKAVLRGHAGPVISMAFSPKGKMLVSGGQDNSIRFWDTSTSTEAAVIRRGHAAATIGVPSVAFSADGGSIATAQNDGSVILWDATTRSIRHRLQGYGRPVDCVRLSPDGKLVAATDNGDSARPEGYISLWDVKTGVGRFRVEMKGEMFDTCTFEFLADSKTIVCGHGDGSISVWDVTTGEKKIRWKAHSSLVTSVLVSPDSKVLITGSFDGTLKLWDTSAMLGKQMVTPNSKREKDRL